MRILSFKSLSLSNYIHIQLIQVAVYVYSMFSRGGCVLVQAGKKKGIGVKEVVMLCRFEGRIQETMSEKKGGRGCFLGNENLLICLYNAWHHQRGLSSYHSYDA